MPRTARKDGRRLTIVAAALLVALTAWPPMAHAATPTAPLLQNIFPSGVGQISMNWWSSSDASGHAFVYDVYKCTLPVNSITFASSTLVTSTTLTAVTVAASSAETTQSYVWYYAVRARDILNASSAWSSSWSPNAHAYPTGIATFCGRCHVGYPHPTFTTDRSSGLCYRCHARTDNNASATTGDQSTIHIKQDFLEYPGQTAGSKHRSAWMTTNGRQCAGCHRPHLSPYNYPSLNSYEASSSFFSIVRIRMGVSSYLYPTRHSIAQGNAVCFGCHGSSATPMTYVGDAGEYGTTGGDHNSAGFGTAAHGPAVVLANNTPTTNPAVQCGACHDKHAAAADKLIDYRDSNTTSATLYAGVNLCFKCHSLSSTESKVTSTAGKPFAWNGRSAESQFGLASHHPYQAAVVPSGTPASVTYSTTSEFTDFTRTNTVADATVGNGALRLTSAYVNATPYTDGFESGNFTTGGWTSAGDAWRVNTLDTHAGTYKAEQYTTAKNLLRTGSFQRTFNTSAYASATLRFWYSTTALSNTTDYVRAEYSINSGASWTTIAEKTGTTGATAYTEVVYDLPIATAVIVRFTGAVNATTEFVRVDDVTLATNSANGYVSSGTARSPVLEPAGFGDWTSVTGTQDTSATASIVYDVLNGADDSVILANRTLPIDLTGVQATSLRLDVKMSNTTTATTPYLRDLTINYATVVDYAGTVYCANCHNVHYVSKGGSSAWDMTRASDPDNTKNPAPSPNAFCLRCHDGSPPAGALTSATVVPSGVRFGSRISAPYFPGWSKGATGLRFVDSGHAVPTSTASQKAGCYNCHDPHASTFARLTAWTAPFGTDLAAWTPTSGSRENTSSAKSREENLCYQCHGNGTTGKRAPGAKDVASKAALGNRRHDPANDTGAHSDLETPTALGLTGGTRHSECVDCHDPHTARQVGGRATHGSNPASNTSLGGGALLGAWGAKPAYSTLSNFATPTAGLFSATRFTGADTDFEAYLCFKCHSASTTFDTATYTDPSRQFNPGNFSEHNVLGQNIGMESNFTLKNSLGTTVTVTWSIPAASTFLVAGWTTDSKVTCTDCHDGYRDTGTPDPTTMARGPHGAATEWLLDPDYVNWSSTSELVTAGNGMSPTNIICAKCHTSLATSNSAHSNHDGRGSGGGYCRYCHTKVPHGWKRPRLLGYTNDPAPYATLPPGYNAVGDPGGLLQITVTIMNPNSWAQANCNTSGCSHKTAISPYWP